MHSLLSWLLRQHVQLQTARRRGLRLVGRSFSLKSSVSQFGLVHTTHQFLQFDGERHVALDPQLPRHEGHRGLHLACNDTFPLQWKRPLRFNKTVNRDCRSPANILLKSLESIVMTTSALADGSPCPAAPEPLFRSRNQTPACSPGDDTNITVHTHRKSL